MFWQHGEVLETLRMIEVESLDIRTVTMGISLRGAACDDAGRLCDRIYDTVVRRASKLKATVQQVQAELGVPIVNCRVSVTPVAIVSEGVEPTPDALVAVARTLDRAAQEVGVDYIAGFTALVEKGSTPGDRALIDAIPEAIASTQRVCASVNLASSQAGINMDAVRRMGQVILDLANRTADRDGIGCAKLVVFANAVSDNPFIAGAFHGVGEAENVINVGVSGPGVVLAALKRLRAQTPESAIDFSLLAETIKRMAFKVTRAGELVGREVVRRLGPPLCFGVVDLSLAPTPAVGDSVAEIIELLGLECIGAPGTTAALALLTDAVKRGGMMASSSVGGLSGAFIPLSEDAAMARAAEVGALTIEKLEAMTAICSVGLDMVTIPGDTPATTISGIIADECAIGVMNHKTTACRLIPVPGKKAGERAVFGGLLGESPVMPVNTFSSAGFVRIPGRIPAPLHALRN
ncbi:MAG: PFL family protein [Pseudomonadota bacterium]